jgi:hypothetical protein
MEGPISAPDAWDAGGFAGELPDKYARLAQFLMLTISA